MAGPFYGFADWMAMWMGRTEARFQLLIRPERRYGLNYCGFSVTVGHIGSMGVIRPSGLLPVGASAARKARFLLSAEEPAIVRQMSNKNAEVKSFFTVYEAAERGLPESSSLSQRILSVTRIGVLEHRLSRSIYAGLEVHAGKSDLEYAF
jgi:hypothetical protein